MSYYVSTLIFLFSCFLFSFYYKHILMTIISLEFLMVSLYFNMYLVMIDLQISGVILLIFLVMSVCEGVLGLTLIVLMVRLTGNDYTKSLMSLKW